MSFETSHPRHLSIHWLWIMSISGVLSFACPIVIAHAEDRPVSFVNDVVPVLTKAGCNTGLCHAKAGGGQNGFQLSLLGFEPAEDFEHMVLEGRGRRLLVANPEQSLLLLKPSGQLPHGGGVRLPKTSPGYATLRDWIRQGALMDYAAGPKLFALDIEPKKGLLRRQNEQQLNALARYSDGSER